MTDARDKKPEPRPPSLVESAVPILTLIGLLALAFYLFGSGAAAGPNQIALTIASLVAAFFGWRCNWPLEAMREAAVGSVNSGLSAIFILFAVGALIGTWALSGTLMAMVYYGLTILNPNYFYLTCCIICAVVALSIGSSWTVAGTIGIGLMGISNEMALNPAITAGAVISGAYFGDKSSPLSDTTNLACAASGANLYEHIREALWTSAPSLVLTLIIFYSLGERGDFDATPVIESLGGSYRISLVQFLPLLVVLALAMLRWPPFTTIFLGALAGGLLAVLYDPARVAAFAADPQQPFVLQLVKGVWQALASGYLSETGNAAVDKLLTRGGMESMLSTIWLIIAALGFGGIVEKAGILDRLLSPLIAAAKSTGALIAALATAAIGANILASDQYIAIVLPGRMFRQAFVDRKLAPVVLSRAVGDTATVTSPLIPWNSCGAFMAATLGVATMAYLPFCFFNLLNPLITVVFGMTGLRMIKDGPPQPSSGWR
ncbi:Na+/H+ antiporter NhaC [Aestuariivirga sp.]|uniref:Na+/H+ antiporter NhaC n=1 Tax=Aestuariivirga sp. TaxID=2650926 RepID=UPI0025C44495|nr:Na+/H+ antiporter NhaC [Aestuariivirga sp.]MCA3554473.1 Na+/H+ antiporter NhaC [Aestuariivirga sp.]